MFRTFSIAVGVIALAGSANAEGMKVNLVGKSPDQVRAAVQHAAEMVCNSAYLGHPLAIYEVGACVRETMDEAMSKIYAPGKAAFNQTSASIETAAR